MNFVKVFHACFPRNVFFASKRFCFKKFNLKPISFSTIIKNFSINSSTNLKCLTKLVLKQTTLCTYLGTVTKILFFQMSKPNGKLFSSIYCPVLINSCFISFDGHEKSISFHAYFSSSFLP